VSGELNGSGRRGRTVVLRGGVPLLGGPAGWIDLDELGLTLSDGRHFGLGPGDRIVARRTRWWPSPWGWVLDVILSDGALDGERIFTPGVAQLRRRLATDPRWRVDADRRHVGARVIAT
jgi:hypothetical protein